VHPSKLGTYLTACVFYATLTDASPVGLNAGGTGLQADDVTKLQQLAWAAYTDFRDRKQPLCRPASCIRFQDTVVPTSTTTTTVGPVPTTLDPPNPPLPTGDGCRALRDDPSVNLLAQSVILDHAQGLALSQRLVEDACADGWAVCYNASADGFSASTFHAQCDFKGPTLGVFRVGHVSRMQMRGGGY
jgi:hypothetical protein